MARQPGMAGRTPDMEADASQTSQNDLSSAVEALTHATQALVSTANQLTQLAQGFASSVSGGGAGGGAGLGGAGSGSGFPAQAQVNIWEDDPFSEAVPTANPRNAVPIASDVPQ